MVLLANVTISTARSAYTASTGTSAPEPYTSFDGHVGPVAASDWVTLPTGVFEAKYKAVVDVGTDAHTSDKITSMVLKSDGMTPWPGSNPNESFWIVYITEGAPGPLAERILFIGRFIGGGQNYS